jgi:hypothetical protein
MSASEDGSTGLSTCHSETSSNTLHSEENVTGGDEQFWSSKGNVGTSVVAVGTWIVGAAPAVVVGVDAEPQAVATRATTRRSLLMGVIMWSSRQLASLL